ncbi:MAG TPA: hypothetical protein PLJ29_04325, partial [Leptospiraceae bacterium]|nr:hypothetical protein [Leptospiraceae bacterium]
TYYSRSGAVMKKYFDLTMQKDISLNGEYYASVVYNLLVQDGLRVRIFEISHMLQWGTPENLLNTVTGRIYSRDWLPMPRRKKAYRRKSASI